MELLNVFFDFKKITLLLLKEINNINEPIRAINRINPHMKKKTR